MTELSTVTSVELSQHEEMQKLGISTDFELRRFNEVQMLAGTSVAMQEIQRNLEAYEREFLQDEPVGIPHNYHHLHGELFSEAVDHPLFNIKNQIDSRERNGETLRGFEAFEERIMESQQEDEVVVWYSPAGRAGTEGPFQDIYFDSGRLYFSFKNGQDQSIHLDIKVNEELFPIKEFLDYVNYMSNGFRSPPDLSQNQTGYYYLESPINTKMQSQEFLSFFHEFAEAHNEEVYVSQRESLNPKPHTLVDISQEVSQFMSAHMQNKPARAGATPSQDVAFFTREQISALYLERIAPYLDQHNGKITLYGCSTTSTISNADFNTSAGDTITMRAAVDSIFAPYSSISRIFDGGLGAQSIGAESSKKKDPWKCVTCPNCEELVDAIVTKKTVQCPECKHTVKR